MGRLTTLFVLATTSLFAFESGYVTFEQPEGWVCERAQGIYICQSGKESEKRESVVLVLATLAVDGASLDSYEGYLKQSRPMEDDTGKKFDSEVRYVRKRNINGQNWVDSLQYNSELPGYWSRYVATVSETPKAKLEILVTYVVSDEKYKDMAPQFERMIGTLKPAANLDITAPSRQGDGPVPMSDILGGGAQPNTKGILDSRLNKKPGGPAVNGGEEQPGTNWVSMFLLVLVVGAVAYIIIRRRKRQQANQPPQQKAS